jgi:hypothetical protein
MGRHKLGSKAFAVLDRNGVGMMTPEMLWNFVLSGALGLIGWVLKNHVEEVKRLQILLNRTREEVARDYVTKTDVQSSMNMLIARIDNLDKKIDELMRNLAK